MIKMEKIKCYEKELQYIIPQLKCSLCSKKLYPGDGLYSVVPTWGNGCSTCKECYDKYEIDWSLHITEDED